MKISFDVKLDYCDVLLRPKRSDAPSRKDIALTRTFKFKHCDHMIECIPIIAANMDTIGTPAMAKALTQRHMLTCLHKFLPADELVEFYQDTFWSAGSFYTLGLKKEDWDKLMELESALPHTLLCLDAANGYTEFFVENVRDLRKWFPKSLIMAGNVATQEMTQELLLAGADIVKIGIGPGSVCETRIVTGVGYPQLSAVMECAEVAHGLGGHICADGGCVTPGDVAKAFGAGADFVMLGGMLAGTDESGGQKFYGMASQEAQDTHYAGGKDYITPEGKCVEVDTAGPVDKVLQRITGGLRSACSYVGASCLKDLPKCATFVRVNRTHNQVFGD